MKRLFLLVITVVSVFGFFACDVPLFNNSGSSQDGTDTGEASLSIDFAGIRNTGYTVTAVDVSLTHQTAGTTVTESLTVDSANERATGTVTDLRIGTWDLTVELYESGTLIGSGTGTVEVLPDQVSNVTVQINLDTGDVNITVDWRSSSGGIGDWSATSSLVIAKCAHSSVTNGNYVYAIGGWTPNVNTATIYDVEYAPINSDGSLGSWVQTTDLHTRVRYHDSVIYNNTIYTLGGDLGNEVSTVQYATINSDGTLGQWNTTTNLPIVKMRHTSIVVEDRIYVIGGMDSEPGGNTYYNDVDYTTINSDGTIGDWTSTTSFPINIAEHSSLYYNGYMYVIGGYDGTNKLSDVYYAPVNSDGTLGSWQTTTPLSEGRCRHSSVIDYNFIYVVGGNNASGYATSIEYAPVNADGTIGQWSTTTSMPADRTLHTSVETNGKLYIIGGSDSNGEVADVYYAQFN